MVHYLLVVLKKRIELGMINYPFIIDVLNAVTLLQFCTHRQVCKVKYTDKCEEIPTRKCRNVQKCKNVPERICKTVNQKKCNNVSANHSYRRLGPVTTNFGVCQLSKN